MNNEGAVLSRKNRFDGPKKEKKQGEEKNYGGLLVFLVFLSMFLLASAPVYGMVKNQPKLTKSTTTATSTKSSSSKSAAKASSSASSDSSAMAQSSSDSMSSSAAATSSDNQDAAATANADTAVLAAGQTLYNFAITHNTSPANIVNLNPGLTVQNYSQYAGQSLKIK
ncbi:peptidoglycan-binding protein LysM [Fructobacillus sp. M158]|uniref:peptidoglycan-binding protein LysM n=1 Tax=Fructobacillus parabroussonetiae TaxID=2713174 RepID=UPI00200AA783|nr:peptidoglycan-binding protein LysM [Fructobacillus parabroussonetiae]MCK8617094.1 peptidoglycan-binding protein LysM [Fructobacillus parabroussonetiae]